MKLLHLGNTSMDLKAFPIKRAKGHKIINAAAADVLNTSNAIFSLFQKWKPIMTRISNVEAICKYAELPTLEWTE